MAIKNWVGGAQAIAGVDSVTVTAAGVGTIYKITHPSNAVASYTGIAGDTTASIASGLANAVFAASSSGAAEFAMLTPSVSGSTLTLTGPPDGAPVVWTPSVSGGSGTMSAKTTVKAAQSPHDYGLAQNWYPAAAVPGAGDTVVIENGETSILYNLNVFVGTAFAKFVRRRTFTGRIGLPERSELGGFKEYRLRYLGLACPLVEVYTGAMDSAGQFLFSLTTAGPTTFIIASFESQPSAEGYEPVEVYGFSGASTLNIIGSGVRVCPITASTSTLSAINAVSASVFIGSTTTLTSANINASDAIIACDVTTLILDKGGVTRVADAASITTLRIQQGTYAHQSTGGAGAVTIGSDGVFECAGAVSPFAVTSISLNENGTLNDPYAKIIRPYTVTFPNTSLPKVRVDFGTGIGMIVG